MVPRSSRAVLVLVVAAVLWGTGGLLGSLLSAASGLGPLAVAAARLAVGGFLVLGRLAVRRSRPPRHRAARVRVVAVAVLSAVYQAGYFTAIALTSVSLATLINIGAVPVLVLAVERATGRRRLDPPIVGGVTLALLGLALLVGVPATGHGLADTLLGAACATGSAAGFAAVTLLGSRRVEGLDELTVTGYGFVLGATLLAPVAVLVDGVGFTVTPASVLLLLALGLGPTALAYTLYFGCLHRVSPTTAGVLTLVEPLTSAALAAAVLGDRLGPVGIGGAVLLGLAVLLVGRS